LEISTSHIEPFNGRLPVCPAVLWCGRIGGEKPGRRAGPGLVKDPALGVDVHFDGKAIQIDLYVIVEYGTRIKSVAGSVSDNVRYQVEKVFGLPVSQVNVHVRGLRISDTD
jgi:hypothetical protein